MNVRIATAALRPRPLDPQDTSRSSWPGVVAVLVIGPLVALVAVIILVTLTDPATSSRSHAQQRPITCDGPFDHDSGHDRDNTIADAEPAP